MANKSAEAPGCSWIPKVTDGSVLPANVPDSSSGVQSGPIGYTDDWVAVAVDRINVSCCATSLLACKLKAYSYEPGPLTTCSIASGPDPVLVIRFAFVPPWGSATPVVTVSSRFLSHAGSSNFSLQQRRLSVGSRKVKSPRLPSTLPWNCSRAALS